MVQIGAKVEDQLPGSDRREDVLQTVGEEPLAGSALFDPEANVERAGAALAAVMEMDGRQLVLPAARCTQAQ
jgi:hypothetical protein